MAGAGQDLTRHRFLAPQQGSGNGVQNLGVAQRKAVVAPVSIGEFSWIASDVTVMPGVTIGAHCVIGARSLVTRDVPPHTLAFGIPAEPRGAIGDRSRAQ